MNFKTILNALGIWLLSMFLLHFYVKGDQIVYSQLYDALANTKFAEVSATAYFYVTSIEPVSNYILWIGAIAGVPKNIYISCLNVLLIMAIFKLLRRYNSPKHAYLFVVTNFYIVVLMTGAERLKIAYILLALGVLSTKKLSRVLLLSSPLGHAQSIILLISAGAPKFFNSLRSSRYALLIAPLIVVIGGKILFGPLQTTIEKGTYYLEKSNGIFEIFNIIVLVICSYILFPRLSSLYVSMLILIIAAYIFGGMRVNMIAFTLFFYTSVRFEKLAHPLVILIMLYFSIKSVPFVMNIILLGNGFA